MNPFFRTRRMYGLRFRRRWSATLLLSLLWLTYPALVLYLVLRLLAPRSGL